MAQLSAYRTTLPYGRVPGVNVLPQTFAIPQAANSTMYQGGLAAVVSGYAQEAASGQAGTIVGKVAGWQGGVSSVAVVAASPTTNLVTLEQGCFMWDNPDPLTYANFGVKVYAKSDHEVTATAGSNAAAGYFVGLDSATGLQAMVITILGAFGIHT